MILVLTTTLRCAREVTGGIKRYCSLMKMGFQLRECIDADEINTGNVYIIAHEDELAQLIRIVRQKKLTPGKDIGIISFNETALKVLLDITVFPVNLFHMEHAADNLIVNKKL